MDVRALSLIALSLMLGSAPDGALAQDQALKPQEEGKGSVHKGGVSFAIVDVQKILQSSKAATHVQEQLDVRRSKFQTEIAAEEADLREAEKKLAELRDKASSEDYIDQEHKLQQRFMVVERQVQARRKALDQGYTDSMNVVRKGLVDIVSQIAKERGVDLVVVKQQVIWNNQIVDITDEVLSRMDKTMPVVQINMPSDEEILKDIEPSLASKEEPKAAKGKATK